MTNPITPSEVLAARCLGNVIRETINNLITQEFNGTYAYIKMSQIENNVQVQGVILPPKVATLIISEYQKAGWNVKWDNPGFNETYDAYFTFSLEPVTHSTSSLYYPPGVRG